MEGREGRGGGKGVRQQPLAQMHRNYLLIGPTSPASTLKLRWTQKKITVPVRVVLSEISGAKCCNSSIQGAFSARQWPLGYRLHENLSQTQKVYSYFTLQEADLRPRSHAHLNDWPTNEHISNSLEYKFSMLKTWRCLRKAFVGVVASWWREIT